MGPRWAQFECLQGDELPQARPQKRERSQRRSRSRSVTHRHPKEGQWEQHPRTEPRRLLRGERGRVGARTRETLRRRDESKETNPQ